MTKENNLREVSLEEMKSITIDGLKYLKSICDRYGITYYLAYGTLLGAVRHKGYIPWDDDIDIWIPRKDYDRLIGLLHHDFNEDWEVVSNNVNNDYLFEWAKLSHKKTKIMPSRFVTGLIYGVSIDLFPLDDVSSADSEAETMVLMEKVRKHFFFVSSKYRGMANTVKTMWKKKLYQTIFKISNVLLGPYSNQIDKYNNNLKKLGNGQGDYLICSQTPLPVAFRSEWFKQTTNLLFEGSFYKAPCDYNNVLTSLYGDYMQLPPEEKRVTHHYYKVYYRE